MRRLAIAVAAVVALGLLPRRQTPNDLAQIRKAWDVIGSGGLR